MADYNREFLTARHSDYDDNLKHWNFHYRSYLGGDDFSNGYFLNRYILEADEINYNESKMIYEASNNIKLKIKDSDYYIFGNSGIYDSNKKITKIYDEPLLKKHVEKDTFYLTSDTILAYGDENSISVLRAFHNVKFYRDEFTGKSDSMKLRRLRFSFKITLKNSMLSCPMKGLMPVNPLNVYLRRSACGLTT